MSARWRHRNNDISMHRWLHLYSRLIVLAAICYFHEAQVVAKNSSIQLRCLLDDIVPFYLDFTVYTTLYLADGTHFHRIT